MRIHEWLDYLAREHPEREFATQGTRSLCYAEARSAANRLAHALRASGLQPGERFAFLAKNCLEYSYLFFAASKSGAVPVPLNFRLAGPELAYIVRDSGAKLIIAQNEYVSLLESVRGELGDAKAFVSIGATASPGWHRYDDWTAACPDSDVESPGDDGADLYQMYTSGTTGRPKGAILTHRALTSNVQQVRLAMEQGNDERVLIVAPLYHAAAALTMIGTVLGGSSLLIQEDFNPQEVVRALSEERITRTTLVPAMIQACLLMVPDIATRKYPDLKLIVYGASPIAEETLRRAMEVFRCDFAQGFGMTETSAVLTVLTRQDHRRAMAGRPELLLSAGRALPGTQVRIVDENDNPLPPGTVGEIAARGDQLMRAYWNLPEATVEALRGGWLHTGDAGRMDADGYVYIEDRVKDMIVSGGENIYPREVENVLFGHPSIADAAVIGVPDAKWGETVKAVLQLKPGAAVTAEEVIEFCRGKLAGYKLPRSVDFVTVIPRNASGKVLKRELREKYWAGHTRRVS
jgi:acyl-CoA synthetase (AMP-forming)/AMP-acid ligase II